MHISTHIDWHDSSSCTLDYEEAEGWLRATWLGEVDSNEAYEGAARSLHVLQAYRCPFLLNDNSQLTGPWFDSVEWLQRVWAPQAVQLGLRYIAHVVQPHNLDQQVGLLEKNLLSSFLELQVFDKVEEAEEWLRAQH